MTTWHEVGPASDIPDQQWKIVSINNLDIAVINLANEFFAFEDSCTHTGCPFVGELPLEDETIVCPWHGARFDVRTGKVLEPPACEDLSLYTTKIDNGIVYVGFDY